MKTFLTPTIPGTSKDIYMAELQEFREVDPAHLSHFEILFIRRGTGTLTIDLKTYVLGDDTMCWLAPGQYRSIAFRDRVDGDYISIAPDFFHVTEYPIDYRSGEQVTAANPELGDLIKKIKQELIKEDETSPEVVRSFLRIFLICLRRADRQKETVNNQATDHQIVKKFFESLHKDFITKKMVADYADSLCITANYLNAVVKRRTGFPVSHHIQQHIIMEAKRHAVYSRLRMKEIADRLGFEDCAHFSKFFKNYSGVNFTTFKRTYIRP